jgi:hypothetical protein
MNKYMLFFLGVYGHHLDKRKTGFYSLMNHHWSELVMNDSSTAEAIDLEAPQYFDM